jgi:hypothetical protein
MSTEKIDLAALDRDLQEFARQQQKRGWWRRNWRKLLLLLLLVLIGIGGGAYWWLIWRPFHHEVYVAAMKAIEADKELQNLLGQPIQSANYPVPGARIEEDETDILWRIEGPKGAADAHTQARKMMGKWQTKILEVKLSDGKKISIDTAGDSADEAPPFINSGPKSEGKKPETNAPAPDINMPIPPGEPGK